MVADSLVECQEYSWETVLDCSWSPLCGSQCSCWVLSGTDGDQACTRMCTDSRVRYCVLMHSGVCMFTMQSRQSKAVYVVADFFAHGSVASCNLGLHKTLKIAFCESPYVSICASCMNKSSIRVTPSKKVAHWP